MFQLLIVEDHVAQIQALEEFLRSQQKSLRIEEIYCAADLEVARFILRERSIDLIISDLILPDGTGIDLVRHVRKRIKSEIPLILLTGQPSVETAVTALKEGANDYLIKPADFTLLKSRLQTFLGSLNLAKENRMLRSRIGEEFQRKSIVGKSEKLSKILEQLEQVSHTDVIVIIEGESGTGKELIANVLHENSPRKNHAFIKMNCGALTKSLLESELFGSVRGAFTGAEKDRQGYFEAANGGSLFLDEIGEMDLESQVRLLRVIEENKVTRVGSTKSIDVNVRLIAATNKNLWQETQEGNFREDLYYRLSVIRVALPPLRERLEDLSILFNHFVVQFNEKYDKSVTGISPALRSVWQNYLWPGNIREFKNILEGMVVLAHSDVLDIDDLPRDFMTRNAAASSKKLAEGVVPIVPMVPLAEYERLILKKNLEICHHNRDQVAETLGISVRTLYRKIKEYGL